MKWRVLWSQDGKKMAAERATREEAVPLRNACHLKYSEVELRSVDNTNSIRTEPFEACPHPGGNIQQWTELCLTCGDNIWDDNIDPGPTIPYDQFLISSKKVTFSFEGKDYQFLQYVENGKCRAQGWSRNQKWLEVISSNQDIAAEYFKVFYLEDKEI
jgi:hypothetical protein